MPRRGYSFEYEIKKALERFLVEFGIRGHVRREYQRMTNYEGTDITIDTPDLYYYTAFECKSRKITKGTQRLDLFHKRKDGTSQWGVIEKYLEDTGRRGYVIVELKPPKTAYMIPWMSISIPPHVLREMGLLIYTPIMYVNTVRTFPQLEKTKTGYRFTPKMF